jgi:hypothetical protein
MAFLAEPSVQEPFHRNTVQDPLRPANSDLEASFADIRGFRRKSKSIGIVWYGTLGFLDRSDTKRDGEQHQLIQPDMFEAKTPLGLLRRPAPCVEFSETKGYWADPMLRYRGSDKPEWRS